jgi:hypothetical protein
MRKFLLFYCIVFTVAFLFLLGHSLTGMDEVMLLDPCRNFFAGQFASRLWYAPGTESHFMAYLPAVTSFRILFLSFLPDTLFFHRLPFFLVFIASAFLLFKIISTKVTNPWIPVLAVVLFLNDKGLWDTTISCRSEILQVLLILSYFYIETKTPRKIYGVVKGLVAGLLFLTHPPAWSIAMVFVAFFIVNDKKTRWISSLAFLAPILGYLFTIHFDLRGLAQQLFMDGALATAQNGLFYRLAHCYERFLPYPYRSQPWVILLLLLSVAFALRRIFVKDPLLRNLSITYVAYLLFLLLASGNYYRYNPPLLACMYLVIPFIVQHVLDRYRVKLTMVFATGCMALVSIPFILRVGRSISNRHVNDTGIVVKELQKILPGNDPEVLIIGEPAGYYFTMNTRASYATRYTTAKFNTIATKTYYLGYEKESPPGYEFAADIIPGMPVDGTYRGLKLYRRISGY